MIYIFDYDITYKHVIVLIAAMIMLLGFSYSMYSTYEFFRKYGIIGRQIENIYQRICDINKKREQKNLAVLIERGNEDDKSVLSIIDKIITYSGINKKFKWINTEVALSIDIVAMIVIVLLGSIMTKDFIYAVLLAAIIEVGLAVALFVMANRNYIKVEDNLMQFIGCVENFSATGNDIIVILENVSRYIDPIIAREINRCVMEARNSGNTVASMARLEKSFQNRYWQLIIRNLSICSRYSCNYNEAVAQLKDVIEEYVVYEKERRERYRNNRIMIIILLCIGVVSMYYVSNIVDNTMINMLIGNKVMLLIAIVILIAVVYISVIKGMIH